MTQTQIAIWPQIFQLLLRDDEGTLGTAILVHDFESPASSLVADKNTT